MVNEIVIAIEKIIRNRGRCTVAIDGRCGAGKTSLAKRLVEIFDCSVIHMDDFFLQPHMRTEERLNSAGGNVDCERFACEVLDNLKKGEAFSYRPFVCKDASFGEPVEVRRTNVTLVEGTYSCHPDLYAGYDLHVFLYTDKATQLERLKAREPEEKIKQFIDKWIPLEEKYFFETDIKYKCEIYYKT